MKLTSVGMKLPVLRYDFNPSPERRVPSPNRYMAFARFCFCKNNKRTITHKHYQKVSKCIVVASKIILVSKKNNGIKMYYSGFKMYHKGIKNSYWYQKRTMVTKYVRKV